MYARERFNKTSFTTAVPTKGGGEAPRPAPVAENELKFRSTICSSCVWDQNGREFEFVAPPEAPIFRPTAEEFIKGPLHYIEKIKPYAESHGICKIIPPSSFQPPFTVDIEKFRFTPRVQRLNELEARTRVKLNFLEQIIKYWDLQGASLKIPTVERKFLDLHLLHNVVHEEGGFESCTRDRKWSRVSAKMGFNGTIASLLRQHYERILYPYDVFLSGATIAPDSDDEDNRIRSSLDENDNKESPDKKENLQVPESNSKVSKEPPFEQKNGSNNTSDKDNIESKSLRPSPRRLARRMRSNNPNEHPECRQVQNKELKKLQVYGAGPKMPGFSMSGGERISNHQDHIKLCVQCGEDQYPTQLLKCAGCSNVFHIYCLIPPLSDLPKGVWHCPRCVAYLVQSQPQPFTHEFGFVQSQRDYSLSEYGQVADQFKRDYFRMPPHSVPLSVVEKEFWRLVSSMEDIVSVEYGADLQTNDFGSGFPTKTYKNLMPSDLEYIDHPWNLNNLPLIDGSVFKYINTNISGMIIPWMYVGMCFSTFCFHNEDHWSYSINYLHWGETKSWYGIPGEHADTFERAMKRTAPELFDSQPDLLHQLVTICNPNILMQDGVPIYRINQHAGEFVVTFPRAYHAGFNQGLNFAEAVNFAPSDWLSIGRTCMSHYSMLHRYPVFSHDELICKMGSISDNLDIRIAEATYADMSEMVKIERKLRLQVLTWGIVNSQREAFELLPDDERQCLYCRTTCFLSAITCSCTTGNLVCLLHKDKLCKECQPSEHLLKFRYTLDEMPLILQNLRNRFESYYTWSKTVEKALSHDVDIKSNLMEFNTLLSQGKCKKFSTNSKLFVDLTSAIEEADKASNAARELLEQQRKHEEVNYMKQLKQEFHETTTSARLKIKKSEKEEQNSCVKTKTTSRMYNKMNPEVVNDKLTLEELTFFYDEIKSYACDIPEAELVKGLLDRCVDIEERLSNIIDMIEKEDSENLNLMNSHQLEKILQDVNCISVVTFANSTDRVVLKLEEVRWLEKCKAVMEELNPQSYRRSDVSNIKDLMDEGSNLSYSSLFSNEMITKLQQTNEEADKMIEENKLLAAKEKEQTLYSNNTLSSDPSITIPSNLTKKRKTEIGSKCDKLKMKDKMNKKRGRKHKGANPKDDNDLCSMNDRCLKPSGDEVDWVFCDGNCQAWYHQKCAGIEDPNQIADLEKYYCTRCVS